MFYMLILPLKITMGLNIESLKVEIDRPPGGALSNADDRPT